MTGIQSNRLVTTALAVLLVAGFVGAAVAPATASHDGDDGDTIAERIDTQDDGATATLSSVAAGLSSRVGWRVMSLNPFSDPVPASEHANDTTTTFNENSGTLVTYANNRDLAGWFSHYSDRSNNVDVVEVTFSDTDGGEATRYLVAQYNATSDDYDSAKMTTSTDYTPDSHVDLNPRASQNAPSDLDAFIDDYGVDDADPPKSYRRGLAVQYGGDVESPLIPDVGLREIIGGL